MDSIGVTTTAVPHAATSEKVDNSSTCTWRCCTSMPSLYANCIKDLLVILPRIAELFGVKYEPFLSIAIKFDVLNSSMKELVLASKYKQTGNPSFLANMFGNKSAANLSK